jgi:hypothetical protein
MSNLSSCLIFCFQNINLSSLPSDLDNFVKLGCTGRMLFKYQASLLQTLQQSSPVQLAIFSLTPESLESTRSALVACSSKIIIVIVGEESAVTTPTTEMWSFIMNCIPTEISRRLSMIFYPVPNLPINSRDSAYSDIIPAQSYQFQQCINISENIDTTQSAVYIEYEKHYTRVDKLETFSQVLQQRGGNGTILGDHYCKELGFRLGLLPKYGA